MKGEGFPGATETELMNEIQKSFANKITGFMILGKEDAFVINSRNGPALKITAQRSGLLGAELLLTLIPSSAPAGA